MKKSQNVKQDTSSSEKNSSQTVEIRNKIKKKEGNVKNKRYLTINYRDQTKKLITILQQK